MEEKNTELSDETTDIQSGWKQWLQDNMRIVLSIIIVVAIASGVYSYSKRAEAPKDTSDKIAQVSGDIKEEVSQDSTQKDSEVATPKDESKQAANKEDRVSSAASSQETDESFVETAGKGDGTTHLARRALANYLEKNPDSSLTAEHKIYIEDYLRKTSIKKDRVFVGNSVEISKKAIQDAIEKSKKLNDRQLNNLKKYSARVSSLS